jgi:hypothetical protein
MFSDDASRGSKGCWEPGESGGNEQRSLDLRGDYLGWH